MLPASLGVVGWSPVMVVAEVGASVGDTDRPLCDEPVSKSTSLKMSGETGLGLLLLEGTGRSRNEVSKCSSPTAGRACGECSWPSDM